jgi:cyclopropane-fatty-acyl-phospholipid synthase
VRSHYDLSNEFYGLWLDQRMVYSCGYFPTGTEDLDGAQTAKLEHICRKLRLRPGETLLDIGCGWGGLAIYAAEHYGVHATGVTLSPEQARLARERVRAAGLQDRVHIEIQDYRDVPHGTTFDKVASVGMLEHVGRAQMGRYFAEARRLTRPGGLFLAHGIVDEYPPNVGALSERAARRLWREGAFIDRYIFPDGQLLPIWELGRSAERAGWEVRDLENLREHYARTLRHWVSRLEVHHDEALSLVGETTYRAWRLYMAGSASAFAAGKLGVVQFILSNTTNAGVSELPPTRADIYAAPITV